MKQKITKKGLFVVSAKTIDEKRPEVVALLQRYGMNVNESDDRKKIDMAFLSLLPKSKGFRKDFAKLATPIAKKVHQEYSNMGGYHGFTTELPSGKGLETKETKYTLGGLPSIEPPTGTSSTSTTVKQRSGFGQWLSDTFDASTMQNIINTGLGVWSYQKTGRTSTDGRSILDAARDEMGSSYYPNDNTRGGSRSGLTTTGIVLISVAAIGLIGFAIYKATKK